MIVKGNTVSLEISRGLGKSMNNSESKVPIALGMLEKVKLLSLGDKKFTWHLAPYTRVENQNQQMTNTVLMWGKQGSSVGE